VPIRLIPRRRDGWYEGRTDEDASEVRAAVRERPRWLGGVTGSPGGSSISVRESGVEVHVIPAGEAAMIGQRTVETIA